MRAFVRRTVRGGQGALSTVGRPLCLLAAAVLGFWVCGFALAQGGPWPLAPGTPWPTTQWEVEPPDRSYTEQVSDLLDGEIYALMKFHENEFTDASKWFQSLGFPPPIAQVKTYPNGETVFLAHLKKQTNPPDMSSQYNNHPDRSDPEQGRVRLSNEYGYLNPKNSMYKLMSASAVHEMFHGVQAAMSSENAYQWHIKTSNAKDGDSSCAIQDRGVNAWLSEGLASFIQIAWLEYKGKDHKGNAISKWGHPFTNDYSRNTVWIRHYDQSLDRPRISDPKKEFDGNLIKEYCGYGTWYFWYALGDWFSKIDEKNIKNRFKYIRYIYEIPDGWYETGIDNVDKGLKKAVSEHSIRFPRKAASGLYYFYPKFVAEYLNNSRFYEDVAPRISSNLTGDELQRQLGGTLLTDHSFKDIGSSEHRKIDPNGAVAWKFFVELDGDVHDDNVGHLNPIQMIFSLYANEGTKRDDLHLIVNNKVIDRPDKQGTTYSVNIEDIQQKKFLDPKTGYYEFLVRVVNMAKVPSESKRAGYCLRVEVDGYYGSISEDRGTPCATAAK